MMRRPPTRRAAFLFVAQPAWLHRPIEWKLSVKTEPKITVKGVSKSFVQNGRPLHVLEGIDFEAYDGELVSIIGPSGCGKSTLLNIIAGLQQPSEGTIFQNGHADPVRLGTVAYMQQKDLLFPWRTVMDNAILGLELQGVPRKAARARASALMDDFGLEGFEGEYPFTLSGGMRQRVSFLRTVLTDRDVFLLDEPFGALDALTRGQIQEWLLGLWRSISKTIVLVTHDVDEAVFLSDRVYVMTARPGRIKLVQPITLPRPRTKAMVTESDFVALKADLLESLRDETAK